MKDFLSKLCLYNSWANDNLIQSLRSQNISDESVLKLLSHIALSENIWLLRLKYGDYMNKNFWKALSLSECYRMDQENAKAYSDYIKEKSDADLERIITYKDSKGAEHSNSVIDSLMHVFIHSAYHRAQVAKEVRRLGKEPAYTDYIQFIRQSKRY